MKDLTKQQKGITLIALVITIIVLLIFAGVTIAMLSGENGILSRATETRGQNAYSSACEQVRLAYMTVKTEIMTQKVKNSSYNAQTNGATLATLVSNELKGTEWSTPSAPTYNTTSKAIEITYTNSSLKENMVAQNKPKESGKITFEIILQPQDAGLKIDGEEVAGGQGGGTTPTSATITGIDYGSKDATSIDVGNDLKIGDEEFRVLSKTATQIVAVPHYNITLVTPTEENNYAYPVQIKDGSEASNYTIFANNQDWTNGTDDIESESTAYLLKPYVEAYSAKLNIATGNTGKVSARLGKYSEFNTIKQADGTEITDIATKKSIRNPKNRGSFWLGSSDSFYTCGVRFVISRRD